MSIWYWSCKLLARSILLYLAAQIGVEVPNHVVEQFTDCNQYEQGYYSSADWATLRLSVEVAIFPGRPIAKAFVVTGHGLLPTRIQEDDTDKASSL